MPCLLLHSFKGSYFFFTFIDCHQYKWSDQQVTFRWTVRVTIHRITNVFLLWTNSLHPGLWCVIKWAGRITIKYPTSHLRGFGGCWPDVLWQTVRISLGYPWDFTAFNRHSKRFCTKASLVSSFFTVGDVRYTYQVDRTKIAPTIDWVNVTTFTPSFFTSRADVLTWQIFANPRLRYGPTDLAVLCCAVSELSSITQLFRTPFPYATSAGLRSPRELFMHFWLKPASVWLELEHE